MSLKAFHIFFTFIVFLLAVVCAAWAFYFGASQAFGICSAIVAVAVVAYGIWFVKKSRNIIT